MSGKVIEQLTPADSAQRNRVISAATGLFLSQGYDRVSIDQIAAQAHTGKQIIYRYFANKADILDAVIRAPIAQGLTVEVNRRRDARETIRELAFTLISQFNDPGAVGLYRASMAMAREFPKLNALAHENRRQMASAIADFLNEEISRDHLCDPGGLRLDLATLFGNVAIGGTRHLLGIPFPADSLLARQCETRVDVFLNGAAASGDVSDAPQSPRTEVCGLPKRSRLPHEKFLAMIDAATAEFIDRGFVGAKPDDIATRAGVGRATIFRQFGSKEGLFKYAISHEIDNQPQFVPGSKGLFADDMRALCSVALEYHLMPRSLGLHRLLIAEAPHFPDLSRRFYDVQIQRMGVAVKVIFAGHGLTLPCHEVIQAIHLIATGGVRFIAAHGDLSISERDEFTNLAAVIITKGISKKNGDR